MGQIDKNPLETFKAVYSVALLIFSLVLVCALIFDEQTKVSSEIHPAFAFILMWGALLWLCDVEGGQASMVGLPPIDRRLYKDSHPITWKICEHSHKGDNLDRYLLGRQFMVLMLVFVINNCGAPLKDAEVLNMPEMITKIFLNSGMAMILFTCMVGQLNTQVNANQCMLDFINWYGSWFTIKVAHLIEASGLLHASYLIAIIVGWLAGKPVESNEPPRSGLMNLFFWGRVLISCTILIFALYVTIVALFEGKTTMWEGVPDVVALIMFFIMMSVVGMLEGMQIAFFAMAKVTEEERRASPWAASVCQVLYKGDNLPGFMVGRQLCVVSCFFIIARVTSMSVDEGEENVLGVGDSAQAFFNTGLLGALITTIIASIAWQLVAGAFPIAFLGNPITYVLLRICLLLEATGVCQGAWVIAAVVKKVSGLQFDEVYVGTAEERAAMQLPDHDAHVDGVGHLAGGGFPAGGHDLPTTATYKWIAGGDYTERRAKILANIQILREQANLAESEEEKKVFLTALKHENAALKHVNREDGEVAGQFFKENPLPATKSLEGEGA